MRTHTRARAHVHVHARVWVGRARDACCTAHCVLAADTERIVDARRVCCTGGPSYPIAACHRCIPLCMAPLHPIIVPAGRSAGREALRLAFNTRATKTVVGRGADSCGPYSATAVGTAYYAGRGGKAYDTACYIQLCRSLCVCVCVCASVRLCACTCACACVHGMCLYANASICKYSHACWPSTMPTSHACRPCLPAMPTSHACQPCISAMVTGHACLPAIVTGHAYQPCARANLCVPCPSLIFWQQGRSHGCIRHSSSRLRCCCSHRSMRRSQPMHTQHVFFPHTRAALGYSLRRFLSLVESMKKLCSCICHGCRARFGLLQCCDARGLRPRSSGFYLISCNTQPCFLVLWLSLEPPLICCSEHQARLPSEPQSPLQDLGFCWSGTGT